MGLKWLTPKQYNQKTGLGVEEIKRQCRLGNLESKITDGGFYKVAYYEGLTENDEKLIRENERLRQALKLAYQIIGSALESENEKNNKNCGTTHKYTSLDE